MGNETRQELASARDLIRYRMDALNRLVGISVEINSTLKIGPLLDRVMKAATEITNSEAASVLLVDTNTDDLYFAASTTPDGRDLRGMKVPLEGSIAGTIVSEGRAIIIHDVASDPRHFAKIDRNSGFLTRSILGIPLRIRDKLIGVLEVLNKRQGSFNTDDMQHITILASQAAVAIDNAQLVSEMRQANQEMEKLSKLKSDFITIASHELRTPLSLILGYADFIAEDSNPETKQHVEELRDAALNLRGLIDAMTKLRFVQLDDTELNIRRVTLADLLKGCIGEYQGRADARSQIFVAEMGDEKVEIKVDPEMMTLAINNLLDNAIRFTPVGGVVMLNCGVEGNQAQIVVRDSGIGIAKDALNLIFREFYQAEDPLTRKHGGLGLGLTISRAIIERHKGTISASSPGLGEGSSFTIRLPLADAIKTSTLDRSRVMGTRPFD